YDCHTLLDRCFLVCLCFFYSSDDSLYLPLSLHDALPIFIFFLLTQTLVTLERIHKILWAINFSELVVCAYSVVQSSHVVWVDQRDRKSTRLNSSHDQISYAVFCLKKKTNTNKLTPDISVI